MSRQNIILMFAILVILSFFAYFYIKNQALISDSDIIKEGALLNEPIINPGTDFHENLTSTEILNELNAFKPPEQTVAKTSTGATIQPKTPTQIIKDLQSFKAPVGKNALSTEDILKELNSFKP